MRRSHLRGSQFNYSRLYIEFEHTFIVFDQQRSSFFSALFLLAFCSLDAFSFARVRVRYESDNNSNNNILENASYSNALEKSCDLAAVYHILIIYKQKWVSFRFLHSLRDVSINIATFLFCTWKNLGLDRTDRTVKFDDDWRYTDGSPYTSKRFAWEA